MNKFTSSFVNYYRLYGDDFTYLLTWITKYSEHDNIMLMLPLLSDAMLISMKNKTIKNALTYFEHVLAYEMPDDEKVNTLILINKLFVGCDQFPDMIGNIATLMSDVISGVNVDINHIHELSATSISLEDGMKKLNETATKHGIEIIEP